MLVHFPVALWPAHWGFHLLVESLPPNIAAIAGFWWLAAGTALGWLAAGCGLRDLINLARSDDPIALNQALRHAGINGTVLLGFTVLLGLERGSYPKISHGTGFLAIEAGLLGLMLAGNYFGGEVNWRQMRR